MKQLPSPLFLVGFMGSGKTTVGKAVAKRLKRQFVDTDHLIAEAAGMSITALFDHEGEEAFRTRESEMIASLLASEKPLVVATGGGLPAHGGLMQTMLDGGYVLYLDIDAEELARRLGPGASSRPMLCEADGRPLRGNGLIRRVESLLGAREEYYRQAHLSLWVVEEPVWVTSGRIADTLIEKGFDV